MAFIWRSIGLQIFTASFLVASAAPAAIYEKDGFKLYGDFRARLEADFDSRKADGTERVDRTRIRVRARLGLEYATSDRYTFGLRLRSGSDDSQQSPHITVIDFDDNDTGDVHFNLDRWFVKGTLGRGWGWVGRNSLPFWKQNELFWDDDVTPAGLGLGFKNDRGESGLETSAGYFSLPAGMRRFSGNLSLAQVVWWNRGLKIAAGLFDINANPDDPDGALLLQGNGSRDYEVWILSLQAKAGRWILEFDRIHNAESYPTTEPLHSQVDGFIGSCRFDSRHGWEVAYTYARIEALAINSSYAEDDWVRWGSATQTRGSNMKGHELRFTQETGPGQNLTLRLYLAEAITTDEDGNRFRIDWNYKF